MTESPDEYGDVLRRALRAEADEVVPSPDGLQIIRARIEERRARRHLLWWRAGASAVGAALVAAVVVAAVPWFSGDDTPPSSQVAPVENATNAPEIAATSRPPTPSALTTSQGQVKAVPLTTPSEENTTPGEEKTPRAEQTPSTPAATPTPGRSCPTPSPHADSDGGGSSGSARHCPPATTPTPAATPTTAPPGDVAPRPEDPCPSGACSSPDTRPTPTPTLTPPTPTASVSVSDSDSPA